MKEEILRSEETDHNRDAIEFLELVKDSDLILSEDVLIGLNKGLLKKALSSKKNAIFGSSARSTSPNDIKLACS